MANGLTHKSAFGLREKYERYLLAYEYFDKGTAPIEPASVPPTTAYVHIHMITLHVHYCEYIDAASLMWRRSLQVLLVASQRRLPNLRHSHLLYVYVDPYISGQQQYNLFIKSIMLPCIFGV